MLLPFFIARRYLFTKKSHHAINIISWMSLCGVAIATMAMVCTLSVFNGFQEVFSSLFCSFDPQLEISSKEGKVFDPTSEVFTQVKAMEEVSSYAEVLEENALLRYKEKQVPATVKGVSESFKDLTSIDSILVCGSFVLKDEVAEYGTIGIGLASVLGTGSSFVDPIEIYAPKRNVRVNMANPSSSFTMEPLLLSGIFSVEQPEYDEKYLIVSLDFARHLFRYDNEVSSIELKLKPKVNVANVKEKLAALLGEKYEIKDQYEQQAEFYRMMNLEKWMSFLILSFIMLIATFNIIGSLSMLILEKKEDIITLRNMGADNHFISQIFLYEGRLISVGGALIGILLGVMLCLIQKTTGVLRLGTDNAFVVDAYPVVVEMKDLFLIFISVLLIGFLSVWYPVRYLGNRWIAKL